MRNLEAFARGLSPAAEFYIVVLGAFALPILSSLSFNLSGQSFAETQLTNEELHSIIVMEAIVLPPIAWFLSVRGWSIEHFGPYPSGWELVQGVGLALAGYVAVALPWVAMYQGQVPDNATNLSWLSILAVAILNPLFEELILCAYMIPLLAKRWGVVAALAISLAVRLSFHTYQGSIGLLAIGLFGLVVSTFYARTQRFWPVLIAHGTLDFVGIQ